MDLITTDLLLGYSRAESRPDNLVTVHHQFRINSTRPMRARR